jgi:hypothetical protein
MLALKLINKDFQQHVRFMTVEDFQEHIYSIQVLPVSVKKELLSFSKGMS